MRFRHGVQGPRHATGLGTVGRLLYEATKDGIRSTAAQLRRNGGLPPFDSPREKERDLDRVSILHELLDRPAADAVDPATWSDLDLDGVFLHVDGCTSCIGEQTLYDMLRTTTATAADLDQRDRLAEALAAHAETREQIRALLAPLDTPDAYYLPNLFLSELPPKPRFHAVFPLLTALAITCVAALFFRPEAAFGGLLAIIAINIFIQYRYHSRIAHVVRPLTLLSRVLGAADIISELSEPELASHTARLRTAVNDLRPMRRAARYLALERQLDDMAQSLYAYINVVFLLDINAFVFSLSTLREHRSRIRDVFDALGELDAAIAIAGFRARTQWCRPDLTAAPRHIDTTDVVHPLLQGAVPNDIHVSDRSVLITGSNMAGKTTFIRALAVNALLARTINTCTATSYRAPPWRVRTMIGRSDDLAQGQSYFAAELDLSLSLIQAADAAEPHLFAIDEIFRGTNTTERVAAARAVLARLAGGQHTVFAATHDLELLKLLDERWEFHHFRESVTDGRLHFDYLMHPGPTSTHNAIRMMEVYGFPADVVADAQRVAAHLAARDDAYAGDADIG